MKYYLHVTTEHFCLILPQKTLCCFIVDNFSDQRFDKGCLVRVTLQLRARAGPSMARLLGILINFYRKNAPFSLFSLHSHFQEC
jgi:hypothetical protein